MCPTCLSKDVRRSRKHRWQDIPVLAINGRPCRCRTCYRRFYDWPWFRNLAGRKMVTVAAIHG
jgi:hypothetical protein